MFGKGAGSGLLKVEHNFKELIHLHQIRNECALSAEDLKRVELMFRQQVKSDDVIYLDDFKKMIPSKNVSSVTDTLYILHFFMFPDLVFSHFSPKEYSNCSIMMDRARYLSPSLCKTSNVIALNHLKTRSNSFSKSTISTVNPSPF